jgi:hypothetical protein
LVRHQFFQYAVHYGWFGPGHFHSAIKEFLLLFLFNALDRFQQRPKANALWPPDGFADFPLDQFGFPVPAILLLP